MNLMELYYSIITLFEVSLVGTLVCFIALKLLYPLFKWLREVKNLSWIKAAFVLNFLVIFVLLLLAYLIPFLMAPSMPEDTSLYDEELAITPIEYIVYFFTKPFLRIIVASIVLALFLLFFEFFGSAIMEANAIKKHSEILRELVAIFFTCVLFFVLLLFFFNWVPLGLFVYIFYGKLAELPLLIIKTVFI